jgi:hypothetical protein
MRSGCFSAVAVLAILLVLVQLLAACGEVSEPETTVETVEVEKVVTVIVVPEPTEAPAEEALEPTEAEPMPEPTDELPEATEAAQEPEATEPPQPTPISPGAVVQKELERLAAGRIAYNPPTEMTVDKTERVEVRISMDMAAPLAEGLKGPGEPVVEPIQVSCFMKVRLVSEDFHIVAFSSEEQIVPAEGFTEWAWDVTPTKSGTRSLSLIVTALVKASEAEGEKDLPIIEREIQVKVNPGYMVSSFFVANRGWIFTAVLLPVVAALGRWLWRRQQRNKEVGDPEAGGEAGEA